MKKNDQYIELSNEEIRLGFVSSCVEFLSSKLGMPYRETFAKMKETGMLRNYLYKHYDVIHTESWENVTNDMIAYLNNRQAL